MTQHAPAATAPARAVSVRPISAAEHARFADALDWLSYLHTPEWAASRGANAEALGWFAGDELVGVGVCQYLRPLPRVPLRIAYFPDGPAIRWADLDPAAALRALVDHLRGKRVLEVRIGPYFVWRTWSNDVMKAALAEERDQRILDLPPSSTDPVAERLRTALAAEGWVASKTTNTDDGQNQFNFWVDTAGRTPEQVLAGMNQMYRRNIKKAEKLGVTYRQGSAADLPTFHRLFSASGEREGFYVLPLSYFEGQFAAFGDDPDKIRVYVVELDGTPLAAAVWLKVGDHVFYTRGGSSDEHREARAVNMLQWALIKATVESGAARYDMGGVYGLIDASSRGLLQFKVGTGGYVVASNGEWNKRLKPVLARGVDAAVVGRRKLVNAIKKGRRR